MKILITNTTTNEHLRLEDHRELIPRIIEQVFPDISGDDPEYHFIADVFQIYLAEFQMESFLEAMRENGFSNYELDRALAKRTELKGCISIFY